MKAIVLPEPGPIDGSPLQLRELPVPEPGSGEVLIRVEVCGVCRTDLHVTEGDRELLQLAVEIPLHTHTQEFPLEAANEALQRLKHDQIDGAAVLRVR